jgi:ribokinase
MPFDVVVLGSLHMDIMVTANDRPRRGETVVGSAWSLKCGGKGGNQAVEAARHGAATAMWGMVGSDNFGTKLIQNLKEHGVDTSGVRTDDQTGSGMSVAIIDAQGDYGAVIVSGANLLLGGTDGALAAAALLGSSWLVIQNEVPNEANRAAAWAARQGSARVLYNAAPARPYDDGLLGLVDILVVNSLEAESLCGLHVEALEGAAAAAKGLLRYAPTTIVTAGAAGVALAQRNDDVVMVAAHPLSVKSTHGAGDCFIGALGARLAKGETLERALRYSNAAAALLVAGQLEEDRGPSAVRRFLEKMAH